MAKNKPLLFPGGNSLTYFSPSSCLYSENNDHPILQPIGMPFLKTASHIYEETYNAIQSNPVSYTIMCDLLEKRWKDDFNVWTDDKLSKFTACSNIIQNEVSNLYKRDDLDFEDWQYLVIYKKFRRILTERGKCSTNTITYVIYTLIKIIRNDVTLRYLLMISSDDYVELILTRFIEMVYNDKSYDYQFSKPTDDVKKMKAIRKHLQKATKAASMSNKISKFWGLICSNPKNQNEVPLEVTSYSQDEPGNIFSKELRIMNRLTKDLDDTFDDNEISNGIFIDKNTESNFESTLKQFQQASSDQGKRERKKYKQRKGGPRGPYKRTLVRMRMREISKKRTMFKKSKETPSENENQDKNTVETSKKQTEENNESQENVTKEDMKKSQITEDKFNLNENHNTKVDEQMLTTAEKGLEHTADHLKDLMKLSTELVPEPTDYESVQIEPKDFDFQGDISYNINGQETIIPSFSSTPEKSDYQNFETETFIDGPVSDNFNKLLSTTPKTIEPLQPNSPLPGLQPITPFTPLSQRSPSDFETLSQICREYKIEFNETNSTGSDSAKSFNYDSTNFLLTDDIGLFGNVLECDLIYLKDEEDGIGEELDKIESQSCGIQKKKVKSPIHSSLPPEFSKVEVRRSERLNKLSKNVNKEDDFNELIDSDLTLTPSVSSKSSPKDTTESNKSNDSNLNFNDDSKKSTELSNSNDKDNLKEDLKDSKNKRKGDDTIWDMVQKHQKSGSGISLNVVKSVNEKTSYESEDKDEMSLLIREHYHISENVPSSQAQPFIHAYKNPKSVKWSYTDTKRFYNAIETFGTDLMLVRAYLPEYSDRQIYDKFKLEERKNPQLMQNALQTHKSISLKQYEQKHGKIDTKTHYNPLTDPFLQETNSPKKTSLKVNLNHTVHTPKETQQKVDDKIINLFM